MISVYLGFSNTFSPHLSNHLSNLLFLVYSKIQFLNFFFLYNFTLNTIYAN